MTLPVLAKTYQFNVNQTIAAPGSFLSVNKLAILAIKTSLTGFASNPYVVAYSCNATTAGTAGDGIDRWSTISDITLANNGAAHSWIVLTQAGIASGFQVLISASAEGGGTGTYGTHGAISVYVSRSAGFTGGSTTARPTATDEQIINEIGASSGRWGGLNGTNVTTRVHAIMSTDGAAARVFLCSSGIVWGALIIDAVSNTTGISWSPAWHARLHSRLTSGTFPQPVSASQFYAYDGAIYYNATAAAAALTAEARGPISFGPTSTEFGNLANDGDSAWPEWPMGIVSQTTGARGRHGTMIDLWWGSSSVVDGDTYDASSKTFAQFAGLIVPWDGSSTPALT